MMILESSSLLSGSWSSFFFPSPLSSPYVYSSFNFVQTPKEILAEELEEAARGEQPELMPPKFIQPIETVVAGDGDAVKFTAKVTGKPRPEVTGYVDETEIKDEPEYEVAFTDDGIATLTLPEVIPEDEGMYLCKAVNEVGIATCSAELFVEGLYSFNRLLFLCFSVKCRRYVVGDLWNQSL